MSENFLVSAADRFNFLFAPEIHVDKVMTSYYKTTDEQGIIGAKEHHFQQECCFNRRDVNRHLKDCLRNIYQRSLYIVSEAV